MTHSLDRLSDRERDLLTLLAQGHTAKTIAKSRALSVNAVNEHLRSARRKTDAPSSRELARIFVGERQALSQENRDKLFGIESSVATEHRISNQAVANGAKMALTTWRIMMIVGVLIVAGVLAHQSSVPSQADAVPVSDSRNALLAAEPARSDVIYQVLFKEGDAFLGSPTVLGQFGREVRVEIPNRMRVIMITGQPGLAGKFSTSAKMAIYQDGAWQPEKEMLMKADLSSTPSFEHTVDGTPYRFVIMPRLIVPSAD